MERAGCVSGPPPILGLVNFPLTLLGGFSKYGFWGRLSSYPHRSHLADLVAVPLSWDTPDEPAFPSL
jgi:hypothetical protein